jgi:hypothetical protein
MRISIRFPETSIPAIRSVLFRFYLCCSSAFSHQIETLVSVLEDGVPPECKVQLIAIRLHDMIAWQSPVTIHGRAIGD